MKTVDQLHPLLADFYLNPTFTNRISYSVGVYFNNWTRFWRMTDQARTHSCIVCGAITHHYKKHLKVCTKCLPSYRGKIRQQKIIPQLYQRKPSC